MEENKEYIKLIKKFGAKRLFIIFLLVVALAGVFGSYYFYNKYKSLNTDATAQAKKETDRLVSLLGKLMELPAGETPTIATISDKDKLKDQSFFAQAQNGDILFAYTTSMKAILYRPSSNKIINVAPISINQSKDLTGAAQKTVPSAPAKK
jgi:hypothetical protein